MSATPGKNDDINWGTLISAAALGVVLVGAFWTIVQTQFGYIEKDKEILRTQLQRSQDVVGQKFGEIHSEFERRRSLHVEIVEFRQFEMRILGDLDTLKKQLLLLEQTRPTTGELSGTAKALEARIQQQEERMRSLEQRLLVPPISIR